jgi:hypothetical protein
MKRTIGILALMLTSGAALLVPATAAAQDRDDYGYGWGYSGYTEQRPVDRDGHHDVRRVREVRRHGDDSGRRDRDRR